jgi:hypothetical protein
LIKFDEVGFGAILDGSSNTMMFGEKGCPGDLYETPGHPTETGNGIYAGDYGTVRVWRGSGPFSDAVVSTSPDYRNFTHNQGFGAAHPGTFSVVLGDGSVHSINLGISRLNLYKLGHRGDGATVNMDEF